MTKKSKAREKRDELAKQEVDLVKAEASLIAETQFPNNNWEGLETLHNTHGQIFGKYNEMVGLLIKPAILKNLENVRETTNLVKSLACDTKMLKEQTDRVYDQHKGKTGPATSVEDNFAIVKHFQSYEELLDRHQLLCTPVALQLNEHLTAALGKLSVELNEVQQDVPQIAETMAAATAHREVSI